MPITPTYVLLNQITLAAASSSITFSNIPQSYGDLVLVSSASVTPSTANDTTVTVNGDTGSNYSRVFMFGNGSGTESGTATRGSFWGGYVSAQPAVAVNTFIDYSATDKHKTMLSTQSAPDLGRSSQAQRWASTAAITSMTVGANTAQFTVGSTFSLYGIVA